MSLSCICDWEPEPGDVCWVEGGDFAPLDTTRTRRCAEQECRTPIAVGDLCLAFARWKIPQHDIEIAIWGEGDESGPHRATHYLCEECAGIYLSLTELGFCLNYQQTRKSPEDYRLISAERRTIKETA